VDELAKLQEVERQIEREWWWLSGALHAIAQVSSGDPHAYLEMLTQKRAVDRKRVEVATRIATLVGPPLTD
jgi:hypothetical protein